MAADTSSASKAKDLLSNGQWQLRPALPEDADAFQRCVMRANDSNYANSVIWPKEREHLTSPEEILAHRAGRLRKAMEQDDALHFKIIDKADPERIIAASNWYKPGHFKSDVTMMQQFEPGAANSAPIDSQNSESKAGHKPDDLPAALNFEAHRQILVEQDKKRKEIWGDDSNYWYCAGLSVDPDYQRRGLATVLLKDVLDRADADGVPTYLEATPEGSKLYPSVGFKKIGEHSFFDGNFRLEYFLRPVGGI